MPAYSYALDETAVRTFALLPAKRRTRVLRFLDLLAQQPFQSGDYRETGATGRTYELRLIDDVLLTWWADHAAGEIRVVRIEVID